MTEDASDAKRSVRSTVREQRRQRTAADRDAAADGIRRQLDALVERLGARSLSCYLPTPSEPGTRPFLAAAAARGLHVLLPVTRADGLLDWTVASPDGHEANGVHGVPEAVGERLDPAAAGDLDVLIVPAAAVDRRGARLGWGRGFYDRTLDALTHRPPVYAVIYDSELVDRVPRDPHDQSVDGVVTPTRTVLLSG
ncbi:5-formyltetrahydrofolate cyclo-ligase [Microbacterium betulae]|uniref:5-formyltetrahydrofolate cyclo-ligase n=1 Tax=Microbacterium betulae TaxID=2981139 RepID=A0AA97FKB8_9MICO|nr:5-formyltetrahydrofolate cyclo-ligase [Microbacterium sp. AB]WOF23900.1 5-formyltetrahydrofolate cyclo-ligase [Microbacterium sp. AB]